MECCRQRIVQVFVRKAPLFIAFVFAFAAMVAACAADDPADNGCYEAGPDGTLISVPCPGNGAPEPTPDPGNGNGGELPAGAVAFGDISCAPCHAIEGLQGATGVTGPDLTQIGSIAEDRVAGLSAEEYIRQAIVDPEEYVVDGFSAGIMPTNYGDRLSDEEIDDLVEYLASLR